MHNNPKISIITVVYNGAKFLEETIKSIINQTYKTIEHRQGYKIACLEEIAYNNSWITKEKVLEIAKPLSKNGYGKYLQKLVE